MPAQPAWFHRLEEKWLHPAGRRTGVGLRHLPLAFAGPGWFRHKPHARTVLSPGGVCHSLLLLSAMPVTGVTPPLVIFCTLTDKSSNVINTLREREKARALLFYTIHMLLNRLDLLVLNVQFLTNGGVTPTGGGCRGCCGAGSTAPSCGP